jgi:hypothetical protein
MDSLTHHLRIFRELADWSPATADYVRRHQIPMRDFVGFAGNIAVLPATISGGSFELATDGEASACFEVIGDDGETTVDLCAMSVADPARFGVAVGAATLLGECNVTNPGSWAFGRHLKVHRTPLTWLKAGGDGVAILDHMFAPVLLGQALGPIEAEDSAHALDLRNMLCRAPVNPKNIIFKTHPFRSAA